MGVEGEILVVEDPQAKRAERERLILSAVEISRWLRVPLRVLSPGADLMSEVAALEKGILLLSLKRAEKRAGWLEPWRTRLLERCRVPVLMLPPGFPGAHARFESFFVPMSGEMRANAALDWAIRRGNELGVPVDVFHVTEESEHVGCNHSIVGHVSDAFHHEYPRLVEEFVSEASPFTSRRAKLVIREFVHRTGEPHGLLTAQVRRRRQCFPVLEWKGHLGAGRARLIKELIRRSDVPLLLVRQSSQVRSRLRVGGDFRAA